MTTTEFAFLNLEAIAPSPTNPRKHFDAAKLTELTESIKSGGVHQPILVRPLPGSRLEDTEREVEFEIVSGERRWRASIDAGQTKIPAMVRVLDDAQVLEIQMIENLIRADLSPMEEAEGYETLMNRTGTTVEALAAKIGKSRAYIYARLKLLDLNAECQLALREGKIDASRALLIARIPDTNLHAKALAEAMRKDFHGDVISLRSFQNWLRANVMLHLDDAVFPIADVTLNPKAGSCHDCKKRTKAFPDLLSDVSPNIDGDLCLDPECYHQKLQAHALIREASEEDEPTTDSNGPETNKPSKNTLQDELKHLQDVVHVSTRQKAFQAVTNATLDALIHADAEKLKSSHDVILRAWTSAMLETTETQHIERALNLIPPKDAKDEDRIASIHLRFNACRPEELYRTAAVCMIHDDPSHNGVLTGIVANSFGVNSIAIQKQIQAEVRQEYAARIQEIQDRIDAESGAGNETKPQKSETKPRSVKRTPRLNADEAQAGIAAAMQAADADESQHAPEPAAFAIGQDVRVITDLERLQVKNHKYAGKTGVILRPWEGTTPEWVVKISLSGKRLFLAEELEAA